MFPGSGSRDRGQSSMVGLVLVIGLVVAGTTAIVVLGTGVLGDARADAQIDSAEHAMTKLDATASLVALGTSDTQLARVDLGGIGEELAVHPNQGWMNVTIVNGTTGTVTDTVMERRLGAIIYEHQQTKIAYQGGGVWKKTPTGATMVSPPEFHYRGTTLTLPLVTVGGGQINSGNLVLRDTNELTKLYPNQSKNLLNPVTEDQINVSVTSEYYRAWGRFFQQRTDGDVYYDHANETVTIVLLVQTGSTSLGGGIVSGAAGSTLTIPNTVTVDSYNSSAGDYAATDEENTSVIVAGHMTIENQGTVQGDIVVGKDITMDNNAEVTGNISYGGERFIDNNAVIGGWINDNATVPELASVAGLISLKASSYDSGNNNNDGEDDINDATQQLTTGNTTWTIGPGNYYLSELELESGDELILNASSGNISIVVQNDIRISGGKIRVTNGNGTVRFFNQGSFTAENDANISIPGDDAPRLWMYFAPSSSVSLENTAKFDGVIYGPGPGTQAGVKIRLRNQAEIFGGLVGDVQEIRNSAQVHFDEALTGSNPLAGQPDIPKVTYLHVTVNSINATAT